MKATPRSMSKPFPKPLDTVIEETQEVERNIFKFNPETQKVDVERVKEQVPIKTIYTKAKPRQFTCPDGQHEWYMADRHTHTAKCRKCPKVRFLRAIYETISPEGHIIDRETRQLID